VTYRSRGVRTVDQYACRPWSADFLRNRWLELFADQTVFENRLRIKTTVTVQLRTRSMRGLIVAVHLWTRTVRGFDPSDARGCGKISGCPYCHSAYHTDNNLIFFPAVLFMSLWCLSIDSWCILTIYYKLFNLHFPQVIHYLILISHLNCRYNLLS